MSDKISPEHAITWGSKTLLFTLSRSKRKTLGIQVHPDLSINVAAPEDAPLEVIKEKVRQKAAWIVAQQGYFLSFQPLTPPRKYVRGETHLYLGRQYRLLLHEAEKPEVKLIGRYLQVWSPKLDSNHIKRLLEAWYRKHAASHFQQALQRVLPKFARFELPAFHLHIQNMNKRWGSCSPKGRITLNLELIQAPKGCIEYVVVHELCHLIHPDHTRKFYALQEQIMPDWRKWKDRLERELA
jgi:hypothetical protein